MAQVFLSYASEDRNRVKPFAEALHARGFSVWWDRSLAAGDDFSAVIQRELNAAKAVVVVWTHTSAASVWVRDEAGRARDDGRLIPVMLDKVQIPLGFGAFQAEDFSNWNGSPTAAQMQLLEEALKAKLEGRSVDGGAVEAKRRRLMNRIRIVSVLSVLAAVTGIAAGLNNIFNRPETQIVDNSKHQDNVAELLSLVREGKISPEQAIQLAQLLESQTFAQASLADDVAPAPPAPSAGAPMDSEVAPGAPSTMSVDRAQVQVASVSSAEFDAAARETFRDSVQELLTHPDASVRTATLQLSNPATRDGAMRTLWRYAEANPGPTQATIYRVCGAVGEANDHPLGLRALERAQAINPQDTDVWRMLSYGLRRQNRTQEAVGAALVSEGLQAQAQGNSQAAEQRLQQALPRLQTPESRAFVEGQLGDAAARRDDWSGAAQRYDNALRIREEAPQAAAPEAGAVQANITTDAQKLVRALDRSGQTDEACQAVDRAQRAGAETEADVTQRCVRANQLNPSALQRVQTRTVTTERNN